MKRTTAALAVLAALVAAPVHADALARADNKAGGQITLTDVDCSRIKGTKVAYSTTAGGNNTIFGCWTYAKPDVFIDWNSGGVSTFPAVMFEMVETAAPARQPARGM